MNFGSYAVEELTTYINRLPNDLVFASVSGLIFFCVLDRLVKAKADYKLNRYYFKSIFSDLLFSITNELILKLLIVAASVSLVANLPASPMLPFKSWLLETSLPFRFFVVLFVNEFFGYWLHRLFHEYGYLWDIHKVHHSSTRLVWSNTFRVHPLQYFLSAANTFLIVYFIVPEENGVSAFMVALFTTFYTHMGHSNFDLSYGWFDRIFASPYVHHWHHSKHEHNKNYCGFLSFFDWIFGTLYLPKNKTYPDEYGIYETVNENFLGLQKLPFSEWSKRKHLNKKGRHIDIPL